MKRDNFELKKPFFSSHIQARNEKLKKLHSNDDKNFPSSSPKLPR